ncbi:EamA family transporter [Novosphingobium profundi]|uniref:EamA family transporter n=1 Tax=Novosphingobium profundi TaxID=1774954 RepID=UPI001BD96BC2|nr:EamA family transporter [Novosphingobium profundi]MBT0670374.1 EamA family transporter [Novosphingobium profundi]
MNAAASDPHPFRAGLAILAAQVSVNLGAALAKDLFATAGPEMVAALRTSLAALLLLVLVRPRPDRLAPALLGWIALYGLALGAMNLLIYEAIERLPIGVAVGIEICGPLAVALGASRSVRDLVWPLLAIAGLALLIPWPGRAHALDPAGLGAALGAATCWALYILLGRRAARAPGSTAVSLGMVTACLVTLPAALASGASLPPAEAWGAVLGIALLSSVVPYLLEMRAMARLPARVVGLISSAAPAIAALVGYAVLGETLTVLQALAIALLIAAAAGCSLQARAPIARLRDDPLV